ncbi:MAG: hypothetical protein V1834_01130 [Candidatus Micrarchaeota archaeon]
MKTKLVAKSVFYLGVLLLFLAAYQFNQYLTVQATMQQALGATDTADIESQLRAAGATELEVQQYLQQYESQLSALTETSNSAVSAVFNTVLMDVVAGLVLLALGYAYYPAKD